MSPVLALQRSRLALATLPFLVLTAFLAFSGSHPASAERARRATRDRSARGVGDVPRALKLEAQARLEAVRQLVAAGEVVAGDRDEALDKLDHALEELAESLAPELWQRDEFGQIDPEHLDPEDGHHVFNEERHAAQYTFDAIRNGEIAEPDALDELLQIVDLLVSADRRLAEIAIEEALSASGDEEELEEALTRFADGDALVQAASGRENLRMRAALLYEAMGDSYRHAWDAAVDAVE